MRVLRFRLRTAVVAIAATATLLTSATPAAADAAPARDISQFACPSDLPNPFTDITGSVHETAIRCGALYGIFNGTSSTTFSPEQQVTRGQYASFLARAVAYSGFEPDLTDHGFTDIANNVHRDAINALANLGAVNGTSPTTFSPDEPVNRGQAATMLGRLFGLDPFAPDAFIDDDGTVYESNINGLAALGIVSGVDSNHFAPMEHLSRGAAASIIVRGQDYANEIGLAFPIGPSAVVRAALAGSSEVPGPGDQGGLGTVELVRTSVDGMLCVTFDIDTPLSSDATAAHVHEAAAGVAGPIVLTLPMPHAVANEPSLESSCVSGQDSAAIAQIFANPANFYVNIHTEGAPNGAIRGQLTANATELTTLLSGDEEVPGPGETDGFGVDFFDVMADGTTMCSFLFYGGSGTPMAAHVHKGAAGVAGPIVITLPPFTDGAASDGCVGGLDPALLADIAAHPTDYYVNVHTDAFPDGARRGQLQPHPLFETELSGAAEVPGPGHPDGTGQAFVDLVSGNTLCVALHVRGTDAPTAAHIHQGGAGVAGPIVVMLPPPTFNHSYGCTEIDPALYDDIASDPAGFYVNVHTAAFPSGALRGQLGISAPTRYTARWNS